VPIKRFLFCALLLLYPLRLAVVVGQTTSGATSAPAPAASYDVPSFTAELHRLSASLNGKPSSQALAAMRKSLPAQWNVTTPDHSYSISTAFLSNKLLQGQADQAQDWLDHLADEVASYSAAPQPSSASNARTELDHILAEEDFSAVRPPTPWELLRQRIVDWIERMLYKLFSGMQRYPIGGQILFWLVIVAGVSFIAFWLFRFVTRFDRMNTLAPARFVVPSRTWQEWLRLAREAADRGDSREAVHTAYWAGVVRLQETGVLPKDCSKTPREYLRLATQPSPYGIAPNPAYREPLAGLTTRLERIWYANRTPGPNDFRDSLKQLEALGCPLE